MILAPDEDRARERRSTELLPMQQGDFDGILEAMAGLPVTIRLLDPPLHEFLPDRDELAAIDAARAEPAGGEVARLERIAARSRSWPSRTRCSAPAAAGWGCCYPEIYEMQVRAIVRAALGPCRAREVEIMLPLVGFAEELRRLRALTERVIEEEGGDGLRHPRSGR